MTKEQLKKLIHGFILNSQGIKGVDLAMKTLERTTPKFFDQEDFRQSIQELIESGDILELMYSLPSMESNKLIYFPKGTKLHGIN